MRAFFASDLPVGEALRTEGAAYGEVYSVFPDDVKQRSKWPGDTRAAITPFLAAKALGADSFKWLLSGDDDTVFFTDNVIKLLAPLDHNLPYILSDALWFYNHSSPDFVHFHPHPMAPRCLPCDHDDPTADGSKAPFAAPRGCPCTPALLCESDDGHRFNKTTCELLSNGKLYGVGRFFNIHGGSGVILSSGLMRQIPYKTFRQCLKKLPGRALGGDAMFSRCLWQLGFATTDPGLFSHGSLMVTQRSVSGCTAATENLASTMGS
ncbi:hypothetical protein WJX72_006430 [[Myrmecia] bisecta]|uniref:Uncharacterized protein n=1 Tax=[Myrmecia] bisecta TaxID=41462 RepID=A0AAW1PLM8_9CHLO